MKYLLLIIITVSFTFSSYYTIGDTVNVEHLNIPLNICFGENEGNTITLADNIGKVTLLGIDATW